MEHFRLCILVEKGVNMPGFVIALIIFVFLLIVALSSIYTVKQQFFAVIERFGKYARTTGPGIHVKIPIIEITSARSISL